VRRFERSWGHEDLDHDRDRAVRAVIEGGHLEAELARRFAASLEDAATYMSFAAENERDGIALQRAERLLDLNDPIEAGCAQRSALGRPLTRNVGGGLGHPSFPGLGRAHLPDPRSISSRVAVAGQATGRSDRGEGDPCG